MEIFPFCLYVYYRDVKEGLALADNKLWSKIAKSSIFSAEWGQQDYFLASRTRLLQYYSSFHFENYNIVNLDTTVWNNPLYNVISIYWTYQLVVHFPKSNWRVITDIHYTLLFWGLNTRYPVILRAIARYFGFFCQNGAFPVKILLKD